MTNASAKQPNGVTQSDLEKQTERVVSSVEENAAVTTDQLKDALSDQTAIIRGDVEENATVTTDQLKVALSDQTEVIRADTAAHMTQAEINHNTELMIERMGTSEAAAKREIDRKFNRYFLFLVGAFIFIGLIGGLNFIRSLNPASGQSVLLLSEIAVAGPTALCPGEYLDFSFTMEVKAAGVYGLDMSVFRTSPPPSIAVFSEQKIFVIGSPRTFVVNRHWQVPEAYEDTETNETVRFVPGNYERNIAVGTTSRDTIPSTRILEFSIREDCPN